MAGLTIGLGAGRTGVRIVVGDFLTFTYVNTGSRDYSVTIQCESPRSAQILSLECTYNSVYVGCRRAAFTSSSFLPLFLRMYLNTLDEIWICFCRFPLSELDHMLSACLSVCPLVHTCKISWVDLRVSAALNFTCNELFLKSHQVMLV